MNTKAVELADFDCCLYSKLLVLAPHPDDFDVIGVTLRRMQSAGRRIDVVVARGGSGVDDDYRPGLDLTGKAALREDEQRASADFFGLPDDCLQFGDFENGPDDQMIESSRNLDLLKDILSAKRPDLVFLPHGNDSNSAHRAMYALFKMALLDLHLGIATLLVCDPKTIDMRFDLYTPFEAEEAAWKAALLRFHDSQQQRNMKSRGRGFDMRILDVNRSVAARLGIDAEYAEAFEREIS
jgi:hypothetical protein